MTHRCDDHPDISARATRVPAALRDVLARLRAGAGRVPTQTVRAAVVEYALAMREDGVPPDRMLVAVREVAAELPPWLVDSADVWAIEAYYGGGE
jgi:hypothetical protein